MGGGGGMIKVIVLHASGKLLAHQKLNTQKSHKNKLAQQFFPITELCQPHTNPNATQCNADPMASQLSLATNTNL